MSIKLASRSFATKLSEIGIRKNEITKSNTGSATCFSVRPPGFAFPVGLNTRRVFSNVATNTTGGTQTTVGSDGSPTQNTIHTFTTSDAFTPGFTGTLEYFLVAGGGGGGYQIAGGGGAGGILYRNNYPVSAGANCYITIGAGGAASAPGPDDNHRGGNTTIEVNGSASVLVHGGGKGGDGSGDADPGAPGGCGGGSARRRSAPTAGAGGTSVNPMSAPSYSLFYGNAGGRGSDSGNPDGNGQGGGGGGVGAVGGNAGPAAGGAGGAGLTLAYDEVSTTYGGGGGGGVWEGTGTAGVGGSGIGGNGGPGAGPAPGGNGTVNRGSGGGGGGYGNSTAGAGASGYAVIRYFSISQSAFDIFIN
jgi:hypothetical protein